MPPRNSKEADMTRALDLSVSASKLTKYQQVLRKKQKEHIRAKGIKKKMVSIKYDEEGEECKVVVITKCDECGDKILTRYLPLANRQADGCAYCYGDHCMGKILSSEQKVKLSLTNLDTCSGPTKMRKKSEKGDSDEEKVKLSSTYLDTCSGPIKMKKKRKASDDKVKLSSTNLDTCSGPTKVKEKSKTDDSGEEKVKLSSTHLNTTKVKKKRKVGYSDAISLCRNKKRILLLHLQRRYAGSKHRTAR